MSQPQPSTKEVFINMLNSLNLPSTTIAKTINVQPEMVEAAMAGNDEAVVEVAKGFRLQAMVLHAAQYSKTLDFEIAKISLSEHPDVDGYRGEDSVY